ncbi:MAG: undecaprenyl-diphosphate phosphatase [Tepidisphaeraceae bacterium]
MDYLDAALCGVIEGLTEFLPVSSTAHLRIVKPLLGIRLDDPYWKMFDVVIQLGAVLCLPVYFRAKIARMLRSFPGGQVGQRTMFTHPLTLVLLASICTIVPTYLLKHVVSENMESLKVMGAALVIGGAIMWAADALFVAPTTQDFEQVSPLQAVWIGLLQTTAAIFPGTSRSMATIAAGQSAGLSRSAALEFSFFLSIPTMIAATGYDLLNAISGSHAPPSTNPSAIDMNAHAWAVLVVGFVVSFAISLGVVAWFMHWVRRHGFVPFAIYRIVLGLAVLIWVRRGAA